MRDMGERQGRAKGLSDASDDYIGARRMESNVRV